MQEAYEKEKAPELSNNSNAENTFDKKLNNCIRNNTYVSFRDFTSVT